MKVNFKKNWHLWILAAFMIAAFFVRAYNFHDWLYFEADQARDANHARLAFQEGAGNLPLLGPKAGGSYLHLGPWYYYFIYLSAVLFQNVSSEIFAIPNLVFSVLFIPLAYYFLRQKFNQPVSLLIAGIISSSYVITQYARFSWNPNAIPFWGTLFLLAIYKCSTVKINKGKWLLLAAITYGIVSQLHFVALLGLPAVAGLFWLFFRPSKISWKYWFGAVMIILFFYLPVILNDTVGRGNNWEHFVYVVNNRVEERGFFEKLVKSSNLTGQNYAFFLMSLNNKEVKSIEFMGIGFVAIGFGLLVWSLYKNRKDPFLVLVFSWFVVFGAISFKLAFDIEKPRFWFCVFLIPFIFLALILDRLWKIKKKGQFLVVVIVIALLLLNVSATWNFYASLANQKEMRLFSRKFTSKSLKQNNLVTLENMKKILVHMEEVTRKEGKRKICFKTDNEVVSAYQYIFKSMYPDSKIKRELPSKKEILKDPQRCHFFLVDHTIKRGDNWKDEKEKIRGFNRYTAGAVSVWEVDLTENEKTKPDIEQPLLKADNNKKDQSIQLDQEAQSSNKKEKKSKSPKKKDRLKWRDLW